jgi:uncharacterized protein YecE (DUF72 family)
MKIYAGTSGYGYKEWSGGFYPDKIKPAEMLEAYSKRLETVEIENSFYRMPTPKTAAAMLSQVPEGFKFSLKAPRVITHFKKLRKVEEETGFFIKTISGFKSSLGCALFQFSAGFHEDNALLSDFLKLIPDKFPCAFDFRSETWHNPETYGILAGRGIGLCLEDTDENPVSAIASTAGWGYLRLRRNGYTASGLTKLLKMIKEQKWDKAFVYFMHDEGRGSDAPGLALKFAEMSVL